MRGKIRRQWISGELANLTGNIEALAASFAEANDSFRQNVLGDGSAEPPPLEHNPEGNAEPVTNGQRRKANSE